MCDPYKGFAKIAARRLLARTFGETVEAKEESFFLTFTMVLLVLFVITFIIIYISISIAPGDPMRGGVNELQRSAILERIAPAGTVITDAEQAAASAEPAAEPAAEPQSAEQIVATVCSACHGANSAIPGSPRMGDKAEWEARMAKGMDQLVANAINGINAMPARGGANLSDAEVRAAVEYLVSQ